VLGAGVSSERDCEKAVECCGCAIIDLTLKAQIDPATAREAQSFANRSGMMNRCAGTPIGAGNQPSGGPSFKTQWDSRQLIGKSALENRYSTPLVAIIPA
jgi:hypothetical protein